MKMKKIRKMTALFLAVFVLTAAFPFAGLTANADSYSGYFTYGGLEYITFGNSEGQHTLVIGYDESAEPITNVVIPEQVFYEGVSYIVEGVNNSAFLNNQVIESVTVPSTIKYIEFRAFEQCKNLLSVEITGDDTEILERAFDSCENLTYLTVNGTLAKLGNMAFSHCKNLENVTLSVSVLEDNAFYGCSSLHSVTLTGTTEIGDGAFKRCYDLVEIALPDGLTSIGAGAFECCYDLVEIALPDSITSIGTRAFANCDNIHIVFGCNNTVLHNFADTERVSHTALHRHTELRNAVPKTCTTNGHTADTYCLDCERVVYAGATIPASHSGTYTIAPINPEHCGDEGQTGEIRCSVCGILMQENTVIYGEHQYSYEVGFEPTCTEDGYTAAVTCILCGETVPSEPIPATGHEYGEWQMSQPPTCTEGGTETRWCSKCSDMQERDVPPVGHTFGEWEEYIDWEGSYMRRCCSYCGEEERANLPPTNIIDSKTVDGGNVTWTLYANGKLTISGNGRIPESNENSLPAWCAFYGNQITEIEIGNGITEIGSYAFYNCCGIGEIEIPQSVTKIGSYAFYGCYSLYDVTIPENVTAIGENAFVGCDNLIAVKTPENAEIAANAFDTGIIFIGDGNEPIHNCSTKFIRAGVIKRGATVNYCECGYVEVIYDDYAKADINHDGKIDATDITAFNALKRNETLEEYLNLDFDGDGEVSAFDNILLSRIINDGAGYAESGDVNGDGETNILDLVRLKKLSTGSTSDGNPYFTDASKQTAEYFVFLQRFVLVYDPYFENN